MQNKFNFFFSLLFPSSYFKEAFSYVTEMLQNFLFVPFC